MKKKGPFIFIISLIFSFFAEGNIFALDYTEISSSLANFFDSLYGENEGTTGFRSLLIPLGGRSESLGSAYTGLSDDISYIDFNPAASSILNETEIAFFHNSWIADSNMETLAFTTRFNNFGIGAKISCFYVPFTEYDSFGTRVAGNYYSETTASANFSYNFFSGYNFKGLAAGINLKASWRSVPDYTDNDTGEIISGSGLEQSALAFMGFWNNASVQCGNFFRPVTISLDFRQPVNLQDFSEYQMFYAGTGISVKITKFFSVLGGFQIKGANPRFSLGAEAIVSKVKLNANYTLDLTSSLNPLNRFSISASILLGDKGRAEKREKVKKLYNEGIYFFAQKDYEKAIEIWQEALKIDRNFDPAKTGIRIAKLYNEMLQNMENLSTTHN